MVIWVVMEGERQCDTRAVPCVQKHAGRLLVVTWLFATGFYSLAYQLLHMNEVAFLLHRLDSRPVCLTYHVS